MKYDLRGVSASKSEVHQAIKNLDKGLYPKAFCKILPDLVGADKAFCNIMHADTAGTKTSLAYLYWKETGDVNVWKGIAQDAMVMNLDDMGCVGCVDNIVLSSTIGRNKHLIPGEVLGALIDATTEFTDMLREQGVEVALAGGETADVGDIVRSIDVGYTTFARLPRKELIINAVEPGDVVIGLASYGQASYETTYNSGIGSNGLTSARHDVLSSYYKEHYPESFDPNTDESVVYCGSKRLTDELSYDGENYTVGQLLLSPTRTYLPVLKALKDAHLNDLHGVIHCTGGAQTKVLKFIENCRVIKNNLLAIPPVFQLITEEAETPAREQYQVFNMGHRLELYVPATAAPTILNTIARFNIDAQIIGQVEEHEGAAVRIKTADGEFDYE